VARINDTPVLFAHRGVWEHGRAHVTDLEVAHSARLVLDTNQARRSASLAKGIR
jgi:hypothetical protein